VSGYRLLDRIGEGAHAEVYRALDPEGRAVAVKVLTGEEAHRPGVLGRLAAEVTAVRRLDLPGLVRLFDSGRLDEGPFLAMELIDGASLKEAMAAKRMPLAQVVGIVSSVAETLAGLHAAGIVHRDVKPGNIMLRQDGAPVLMDFGVAALTDEDRTPGGDLLGSPGYMAPELIDDRPWGPQVDVFSLGVVLYMLATRRRPFYGSANEVMNRIRNDEPVAPSKIDPALPIELDFILSRALAKSPDRRCGAERLARDLRKLAIGS
jgi:serine/threonine-protein kinase